MKKSAYLAFCALVIIIAVIAAMLDHNGRVQISQSANQPSAQQPLTIDNSISPLPQAQNSGLNPQPSSTSSLPGPTELEGQDTGTPNWSASPCYRCVAGAGRVCPDLACPVPAE